MNQVETTNTWPVLAERDPPLDLTRENAAYERERPRVVRDHPGQVALIHDDEVVGTFDSHDKALAEGVSRFRAARLVIRLVRASEEPEFISHVDVNHPCCRRLD